jgi:hypothetical protein
LLFTFAVLPFTYTLHSIFSTLYLRTETNALMVWNNDYYFVVVILQVICVIHCLAKSNEQKWIWLIVFVPLAGCLAYLYMEFFRGRNLQQARGLGDTLYPKGRIRKLEDQLRFADTFNHRVALADAYLATGETDKAIALYEQSLTGAFDDNEHLHQQLIQAYFLRQRFTDILPLAEKIYQRPQFARSAAHIAYAIALEKTGQPERAEQEFQKMKARYAHFDARYEYGLFLLRQQRPADARQVFAGIVQEAENMSRREKSAYRSAFRLAQAELKQLEEVRR